MARSKAGNREGAAFSLAFMAPDGKEPPPGAARKSGKLAKRGKNALT